MGIGMLVLQVKNSGTVGMYKFDMASNWIIAYIDGMDKMSVASERCDIGEAQMSALLYLISLAQSH